MNPLQKLSTIILVICFFISLTGQFSDASDQTTLNIVPEKTALSPALLKSPITFTGSGYQNNEVVIVELILPQGMKMKGLSEDENRVTLAVSKAEGDGNFKAPMSALSTLNWLFQVDWTPGLMTPDFKQAKPLVPGKYEIEAIGIDSGKVGKSSLEIFAPSEKK